jgi:hypothetical protein
MRVFAIETMFHLPVFRHRSIAADTLEEACRRAIFDDDWWDQKHDYDNPGATYVSGAWIGDDAAYRGLALPVPPQFAEAVQRKADHFGVLLDLLKTGAAPWDAATEAAIAKAHAILQGAPDPV